MDTVSGTCQCAGFKETGKACSHLVACTEEARLIALVGDMEADYRDEAADATGHGENNVVLAYYAGKADTAAERETCVLCGTALEEAANGEPVSFCDRCNKWAL